MARVVIAESDQVYFVHSSHLAHTNGLVTKQHMQLKRQGDLFELLVLQLDGSGKVIATIPLSADYTLEPEDVSQVTRACFTVMAGSISPAELAHIEDHIGEGEDALLFDVRMSKQLSLMEKMRLKQAPLHSIVRLAFEDAEEAKSWYTVLALALGLVGADHPTVAGSTNALVRTASNAILPQPTPTAQ